MKNFQTDLTILRSTLDVFLRADPVAHQELAYEAHAAIQRLQAMLDKGARLDAWSKTVGRAVLAFARETV